ncbi:hypothetical protein [Desulfocastanea catecholica]
MKQDKSPTAYSVITPIKKFRYTFTLSLVFFCMLVVSTNALSATYYIDYNSGVDSQSGTKVSPWKRHPYMLGWTGTYSHSAGDTFIFKGGVTWPVVCFPLNIKGSGSGVGSEDTYTVDETWYDGETYSPPVFDGEGVLADGLYMIWLTSTKYVKLDGLKIIRAGVAGVRDGRGAIKSVNGTGEGIILNDLELIPYASHAIVLHYSDGAVITHGFKVTNCKISHAANSIESGQTNVTIGNEVDGITITGNEFFDPHTQLVSGDHGDGIHLFVVYAPKDPVYTNVVIAYNKFYGDWSGYDNVTSNTAMIYFERIVKSGEIYNNHLTFSNTTQGKSDYLFSPAPISAEMFGSGKIYNNTVDCSAMQNNGGAYGCSNGISSWGGKTNMEIMGNIVIGPRFGYSVNVGLSTANSKVDYNVCHNCTNYGATWTDAGNASIKTTLETWRSTTNHGDHSITDDPKLATTGELEAASPAFDFLPISEAPTNIFINDMLGESRPQGSAWDAGAYEYSLSPKTPGNFYLISN